jgi:alpha-tubulin suppressor-like RCC1 family protein
MTRWTLTLCLGAAVLTGISCRDDTTAGPTESGAPEAGSALATTTTTPLAFSQVSAGLLHTCGVTTDHRAYCWGWNVFGQVGNGTSNYAQRTPALVAGGLRFRQISAGWYNTCGVTTGYRAYCWGNGILRPMAVPGGHYFRQVSTDEDHTCGVTTDDRAYCWGVNVFGELGNGTTDPSGNSHATPVAVAGGLRFRQVSTGPYHSCGATTNDRAYCWGGDRFGEIGDGSAHGTCMFSGNALPCRKSPTLVVGGYRFRQVEAGGGLGPGEGGEGGTDGGRTCGVTTDNRAFCWGDGSHGQLGNGTRSIVFSPRRVSGGLPFRNVSAGLQPTCGVTTSNRAYCWGDNTWGAVGDGTTTERLTPSAVAGGLYFRQVSAGGYHTCGTTPGSVAYCWGSNGTGSLGDGTTTRRLRPRAVVGPM